MKKLNYIFLLLAAAAFTFQSCEDEIDLAPDAPDLFSNEGAVVSFSSPTPDFFDTGAPDAPVSFDITTLGESATSIRILKSLNGGGQLEHATVSSVPATIQISLQDALEGTGQSVADMKVGDAFRFSFEVTTASGTYVTGASVGVSVSCSTKVPGTYEYTSTGYFCDGDPLTGTVTITETETGKYVFDDFAFGTYQECYGGAASNWGTLAIVRYTDESCDECSQSELCNTISMEGVDNYGDTWTYTVESVDGAALTLSWENTYGEFGTVVLNRPDGSNWPPLK